MRKIDDEIQALLLEHRGDIRSILKDNHRLDLLYALSSQRELLLEWYDFERRQRSCRWEPITVR